MDGFELKHALVFGAVLAVLGGGWIALVLRVNPRLFLRNYPKSIQKAAPPPTPEERRWGSLLGLPLFGLLIGVPLYSAFHLSSGQRVSHVGVFLDAFVVGMVFNLVDLIILDILWLGLFPPKWAAIPGTENVPYRPEYAKHVRGFVVGTVIAAIIALIVSFIAPH